MYAAALPPIAIGWLAIPALAALFLLVAGERPARAAALAGAFGLASFGLLLSWVRSFGWLPFSALIALSALYLVVFGLLAPIVGRADRPLVSALGLAGLWTVVEWTRGHVPLGGFTWGALASTQVDLPAARALPYLGLWGTGTLVAIASALLATAVVAASSGQRRRGVAIAGSAIALVLAPAVVPAPGVAGRPLAIATLQVDPRVARPLGPASEDLAVAEAHVLLHRTLAGERADLIVWGEGALDPAAAADPTTMAAVSSAVAAVGVPTIIGAVTRDADGSEHTAVLALDGTGGLVDRYEKVHLVPFGEYVPWRERLGWVEEIALIPVDRVPGERPRVLRVDGLPAFGAPICFENSFPEIGREMVRDGARFLVLTINNASYGMSAASSEHLVMSRVLAMETGRWVVHAAISGITAVIDPRGSVVATRGLFDPGITRATIAASARVTPAVRLGDGAALLAAAFVLSAALRTPARRRAGAVPRPLESARTLVVLPTYQEALSIDEVLARLLALPDGVDILVVDDGSPDGTADVVRRRMAGEPRVRLRERPGKAGLASAYLLGFRVGLEEGYDLVVEMDSDLSHRPEDLPRILAAARAGQDLTIGSRYVPGGGVSNWSRARLALSRTGNLYARWSLGVPVQDATSGFRAYRSDLLAELVATPLRTDGYGFQIELVDRSVDLGATIGEVPITFAERAAGASKMSRRIVAEALWNITRWGGARRLRRHVPEGTERP